MSPVAIPVLVCAGVIALSLASALDRFDLFWREIEDQIPDHTQQTESE